MTALVVMVGLVVVFIVNGSGFLRLDILPVMITKESRSEHGLKEKLGDIYIRYSIEKCMDSSTRMKHLKEYESAKRFGKYPRKHS